MSALFHSEDFHNWLNGITPSKLKYYYMEKEPSAAFFSLHDTTPAKKAVRMTGMSWLIFITCRFLL